ncbi:MAG: MgtC/SapB family protein [Lentisphaerae bacterium]|nr:MgtC/SapB family protein [Lentisphaerota bacterium]
MEPITLSTWIIRLLAAVLLGGLVGFEREYHGRPAGLRTHILVCLGAAMITVGGLALIDARGLVGDPTRISAGIITGIGFLGAGAIIRTGDLVRGLTTAACIWFVAALGILIGYGLLPIAVLAAAIELVALVGLVYLEDLIPPFHYRDVVVLAHGADPRQIESDCEGILSGKPIKILEVEADVNRGTEDARFVFHLRVRGKGMRQTVLDKLQQVRGVTQVTWRKYQTEF